MYMGTSLVAQMVESTCNTVGTGEVPESGLATHSSILAGRIPWTEEAGGLQSMGSQRSDTTERPTLLLP